MPLSDYHITVVQWGVVIGASLVAAVWDTRTHRIPNWLTLPMLAAGLMWRLWFGGMMGLGSSIGGCLLLALPFVILFVIAGGGAGDAKLMGALGAWLGIADGLVALVAVVIAGAVLGLAFSAAKKEYQHVTGRIAQMAYSMIGFTGLRGIFSPARPDVSNEDEMLAMPYGASIFTGVCIAALCVFLWNVK